MRQRHLKGKAAMQRYLLFDAGCTVCSNLARDVERHSNGILSAQSLTDPKMQELLKQAKSNWQWEPTLLEVKEETCKAFTGVSLRARLFYVLGPRKSWGVAQLVARSQGAPSVRGVTRKDFFKQAGAAVAGITGLAIFGASPAAASQKSGVKSIEDLPGHYAQREGIKAYRKGMERAGTEIRLEFTHVNPEKSGSLIAQKVSQSRSEFQLARNGDTVLKVVFDKANGWCDIEDNAGNSTHFVFTEQGVSPKSAPVVEENREDLSIGAAIQHDLETLMAPPKSEFSGYARAQQCPCDISIDVQGGANSTTRTRACRDAREAANQNCSNCSCLGCCQFISSDCDCFCLQQDFFCRCGIIGHPCPSDCLPEC